LTDCSNVQGAGGDDSTSLTDTRPKALVPLGDGETILGRAVRVLASAGVEHVVLATGYIEEAVREAMRQAPVKVTLCRNDAWDRTQNVASLHVCADAVAGRSFFKLDGDVVFRREVLDRLDACAAPLAVAVDARPGLGDEEMKVLADGGRITAFGKELDPERCAGESMGIERIDASLTPRLFEAIARAVGAGRTDVYYEAVYDELVREGVEARVVDVTDLPWTEIDTPEDLDYATTLVRSARV
jgi:choline kinase